MGGGWEKNWGEARAAWAGPPRCRDPTGPTRSPRGRRAPPGGGRHPAAPGPAFHTHTLRPPSIGGQPSRDQGWGAHGTWEGAAGMCTDHPGAACVWSGGETRSAHTSNTAEIVHETRLTPNTPEPTKMGRTHGCDFTLTRENKNQQKSGQEVPQLHPAGPRGSGGRRTPSPGSPCGSGQRPVTGGGPVREARGQRDSRGRPRVRGGRCWGVRGSGRPRRTAPGGRPSKITGLPCRDSSSTRFSVTSASPSQPRELLQLHLREPCQSAHGRGSDHAGPVAPTPRPRGAAEPLTSPRGLTDRPRLAPSGLRTHTRVVASGWQSEAVLNIHLGSGGDTARFP